MRQLNLDDHTLSQVMRERGGGGEGACANFVKICKSRFYLIKIFLSFIVHLFVDINHFLTGGVRTKKMKKSDGFARWTRGRAMCTRQSDLYELTYFRMYPQK
jgi:hypothetical protein